MRNENSNKRFYWIKLKTNFFERDEIDFILSQQNGCQYVVLYQMLCMKSANNDGLLGTKINEMIVPYDIEKIIRDCRYFNVDTVSRALELFNKLGLIYLEENGALKIAEYNSLVGTETEWAEKKRIYRESQKQLGHKKDIVRQEIDIEKEKELDIELDINIDKDNNKPKKSKYGEYKNVLLTEEELQSLKSSYDNADALIKYLDEYIEMKGYKAKSHYLCIKKWVIDAVKGNNKTIINGEPKKYSKEWWDNLGAGEPKNE